MIQDITALISANLDFIQALAAAVQTIIAFAMLWTLMQSKRTLAITKRQMEASIEPFLDIEMIGPELRLANRGSIEIRQLELIAMISGYFDFEKKAITYYEVGRLRVPISDRLEPDASLKLDVSSLSLPITPKLTEKLLEEVGPHGIAYAKPLEHPTQLVCLVLRYRRAADMRPFVKPVSFAIVKGQNLLKGKAEQPDMAKMYIPLFVSTASEMTQAGDPGVPSRAEIAREELIKLYKRIMAMEDY